jgi:hypothetical protein
MTPEGRGRSWFGDIQVLAVEEVPGDTSPGPAGQQPALTSTTPGAPPPHRHRWPQAIA